MDYEAKEPAREEVDRIPGAAVIEFGSPWCGFCMAAQPLIGAALSPHPGIRHIRIADGKGRRLGRTYRVKLWPTLVFLKDGQEVARVVRPGARAEIDDALAKITS